MTDDGLVEEATCPHTKKKRITELDPNTGKPLTRRIECERCGKWFDLTIF